MLCPYLRETQVRSCRIAPGPRVIARSAARDSAERCSSPAYGACPSYRQKPSGTAGAGCPYLRVLPARYCAAATAAPPVPRGPQPSKCESGCYLYCCAYREKLGVANDGRTVQGVHLPANLRYTANHLWLHLAEDGWCHAGVDGLLAALLDRVEGVTAVDLDGPFPAAVLRARQREWRVAFPNRIPRATANPHLRSHPECVTADPYGGGWLFAGQVEQPGTTVTAGLVPGAEAAEWMRLELERVSALLQGRSLPDGLRTEQALQVFQDLCV